MNTLVRKKTLIIIDEINEKKLKLSTWLIKKEGRERIEE